MIHKSYAYIFGLLVFVTNVVIAHSFHKVDKGVDITVTDYVQKPEKLLFMALDTSVTVQYCIDSGLIPYRVTINNTNDRSVSIAYASKNIVAESDVAYSLHYYSFLKSLDLLCMSSLIGTGTFLYVCNASKRELLEIIKSSLFDSNIKRGINPEFANTPLFKFFNEICYQLGDNLPSESGMSITGEVMFEELPKLWRTGGIGAIANALDWQKIQRLMTTKHPYASTIMIAAICCALYTPIYWLTLCATNHAIDRVLHYHILQPSTVLLPGEAIQAWVFGKNSGHIDIYVE